MEKKASKDQDVSILKSLLQVEPIIVVHMMSAIMIFNTIQDLLLEKACRVNLGYSDKVCDALQARETEKYSAEEQEVQKLIGTALMYRTVLENAFPIVLVFLVGAWSDKYGRKLPMLFVICAFILQNICLILCVYFKTTFGVWSVALVSSVIPALSGNLPCFFMATFSYISDTTSTEKRTTRTGIASSFIFLGVTLGLAAGGILSQTSLGFSKIFAIGIALECYALLHTVVCIRTIRDEKAIKGKSTTDMIKDLFNLKHISDSAISIVKKRSGNTRMKLWLLLFAHVCVMSAMMGENGVMYLFCRLQFNWDAGSYGTYMTCKTVVGFIGNFISMGLLTHKMKFPDPAVGVIACLSAFFATFVFAFAKSSFLMFLAPIISILAGPQMIIPRSIISKIIAPNEIGKVNSFMGSLDAIVPLLSSPLYTLAYTSTLAVLPGAFFLLSAALLLPPVITYAWFWMNHEEKPSKKKE